jgi:hypothetical protein
MTPEWLRGPEFALLLVVAAAGAAGQEPAFMNAATHPGAGQVYSRLLVSHTEYGETGADADLSGVVLKLSYGIRATLAVVIETEFARLSADRGNKDGVRDTALLLKYRLFKKDLGPLSTWRTSCFAGVTIPGNLDAPAPDNTYPRCALATTAILGRHGLNAEVKWEGFGEEADRIAGNGSYLYRLRPAEYTVTTRGAWYSMLESLNDFTDDGDARFDVALGVLYEARRWAWELSARLPLAQQWPQETDYTVITGLRFLP